MERELIFYRSNNYYNFRDSKYRDGYSLKSITEFIHNPSLINELDGTSEIVDISSLSEYNSKQSLAEQVICQFGSNVIFICDYAKWALLEYELRFVFNCFDNSEEKIFAISSINELKEVEANSTSKKHKKLIFYEKDDYYDFKHLKYEEGYSFESINKFIHNPSTIQELDSNSIIVDISSITEYIKIQSLAEEIIHKFNDDVIFICDYSKKEILDYELRFIFDQSENVEKSVFSKKDNDKEFYEDSNIKSKLHKKIVDLSDEELSIFFSDFGSKLYGHSKFKADFEEQVRTFKVFNKLGEHKILSLFLMGDSGVGKTEVARLIFNCLHGSKRFAKINFGNYSNEFSLSSLIGSARGYTGSDDGEIFMKVRDTDIGVLLIDEFEKSNASLFNYFLDVLESGKMTSSLGQELDLNGFIIVFTSNISKHDFPNRISPELRSRFDYKCMFTLLSNEDKEKYLEFRANSLIKKIEADSDYGLSNDLYKYLKLFIDVSKYKNMRDINKQIKKVFVEYILQRKHSETTSLIK